MVSRRFILVHMLSDENVHERMSMWPRRDEVLKVELKDTGTDSLQVSSELGKQQSQGTRQNQGLHVIINLYCKPEAGTGTYWHTSTHLLFLWTVMVALGYGGSQGGSLRLQVAEAQRQGEGEGKSIWDGEGGGQQEEEDEEEAGDEWWRLNGQKVLRTLGEETHFGQIREGDVTVFIQDRGQVGQVQGEWEECATMIPALLQSLLSCHEQQSLLIQQRSFAFSKGLTAAAPSAALAWTDWGGSLMCVLPAPPPHFSEWNRRWGERELRAEGIVCVYTRGVLIEENINEKVRSDVCAKWERKGEWRCICMNTQT